MNDRVDVEDIIDRFREWLDAARSRGRQRRDLRAGLGYAEQTPRANSGSSISSKNSRPCGTKSSSRPRAAAGCRIRPVPRFAALERAIEQFRAVEPKEAQAAWTAGKALAEGLADLDEALARGEREIERAREQIADRSPARLEAELDQLHRSRSWIRRRLLRRYHSEVMEIVRHDSVNRHELFDSFLEGYGLIQKRLRRVMAAEQVERIKCEGLPVDPELMTVIEVVDAPEHPSGTVLKELRRAIRGGGG